MKITGNEPSNPIVNSSGFPTYVSAIIGSDPAAQACIGLTIRQQFAMAAMAGMCANSEIAKATAAIGERNNKTWYQILVVDAVNTADSLIAELNRTEADNV